MMIPIAPRIGKALTPPTIQIDDSGRPTDVKNMAEGAAARTGVTGERLRGGGRQRLEDGVDRAAEAVVTGSPLQIEAVTDRTPNSTPTMKSRPSLGACHVDEGYGPGAAVDLHTGSIVFSDKGTLSSDTYQWLLAEDETRIAQKPCPGLCYTSLCVTKCYSLTLGLALVSLILTVVMTVSSIPRLRGYEYSRQFVEGNCSTSDTVYSGEWESCDCPQGKSSFPCVQVYASLYRRYDDEVDDKNDDVLYEENATSSTVYMSSTASPSYLLHWNEYHLLDDNPCSYVPECSCDKDINRQIVLVFIELFKHPKTSFWCFYNPARESEIIRERQTGVTFQWVRMVLPGLAFIVSMMGILLIWILRKRKLWVVIKSQTAGGAVNGT